MPKRISPLCHRILFFVPPPPVLAYRIATSARQERRVHALMGKPLPPERLHVTAVHLGDYPDYPAGPIARAARAAETVACGPFEMAFDRLGSFAAGEKRPLVLTGGQGLADFHDFRTRLRMALRTVGLTDRLRPKITPHITLLYDRQEVPEHPIDPIKWIARDFVLIDSLVGMTQHVELGRWALDGNSFP
ncbi:MAG TPA: 2'-5' RNA ligase family protein [Alphaproteobacteria bacterium]|jgi:2'-5' RNA ligase|nr:2'-5' RNA ligase family protein [Alphaproteobacteria bacterium]